MSTDLIVHDVEFVLASTDMRKVFFGLLRVSAVVSVSHLDWCLISHGCKMCVCVLKDKQASLD